MTETGGRSHRGQNHGGRKTNCTSNVSSRERKSVVGVQEVRGRNTRVPEDRASEVALFSVFCPLAIPGVGP